MCDELQHYVFIILCLLGCVDSEGVDPDDKPLVQVSACVTKWNSSLQQCNLMLCWLISLCGCVAQARGQKEARQLRVTLGESCGQTAGEKFSLFKTCAADWD